jgi:uncharacterized protein YfdQ (DUF2303 family)
MAQKTQPSGGISPAMAAAEPLKAVNFSDDLAVAAALGADARGAEIVALEAAPGMVGVPAEIPVAVIRGEHPDLRDVSGLFDKYRTHPSRKAGTAQAETLESFIALTNRHKVGDSAIFAAMDWRKPALTAVVDYHQNLAGGLAANGKHRVHYAFPLSEEWKAWVAQDGKPMEQAEFAWFLEDRVPELASPTDEEQVRYERDFNTTIATPARVVELSRGLKVNVSTQVKNEQTLQSGESVIQFEETHLDGAGLKLKVPGIFIVSVAPFFFGEKIRLPVRLRYRPSGTKLVWFYQLYRPDLAITEHVRAAFLEVQQKTGLPGFEGTPEMAG